MRTPPSILAVLAAATIFVRPVHAAQPGAACGVSPPSAETSIEALYDGGVAAVDAGDWPRAYACFLAARDIEQRDEIDAQLARAELKVGKHRAAAERLTSLLQKGDLSNDGRARLQQMLSEAKRAISTLTFVVEPKGAEVLVDGVAVRASQLSQDVLVDPGLRTIEARWPGRDPQKIVVRLGAGESREVRLRMPAPNPHPRKVVVVLDDPEARRSRDTIVVAGLGTAAAALAVGTTATIFSFNEASERDSMCGDPPACGKTVWDDFEIPRARLANVALVSFAGAGVVLGGTLGYFIVTSQQSPQLGVGVKLDPGHAAVSASVTW